MNEYFTGMLKNFNLKTGNDSDTKSVKTHLGTTTTPPHMDINLKRRIIIMAVTSILLFKACFINYWFCSSFTFKLPVVDVVSMLKNPDILPTRSFSSNTNISYEFSNTFLIDLFQDIYLRNERHYLQSFTHTTIIVEPYLQISPTQVGLKLQEGFYNYWSGSVYFPTISVSNVITSKFHEKVGLFNILSPLKSVGDNDVQSFVRQFVFTMFFLTDVPESKYSVDDFQSHYHLLKIGNFSILVSSLAFILILIPFLFIVNEISGPICIASTVFAGLGAFFSLFNLITNIILLIRNPNTTSWGLILFYLLESLIFFALILVIWNEFINMKQSKIVEPDFDELKPISETSIPLSSVYSDPHSPQTQPHSSHPSVKSIDNIDEVVRSAGYKSVLKSAVSRKTEDNISTLDLPFPKTDIFQTEDSSPISPIRSSPPGSTTTTTGNEPVEEEVGSSRFVTGISAPESTRDRFDGGFLSSHMYSQNL